MKKITKLYDAMVALIKVAGGQTVSNETYLEIKPHFRYPGELLERMEQYGYGTSNDHLSIMAALVWAKKKGVNFTEMCVGTQLNDYIERVFDKAVKENNLYLMFSVICYGFNSDGISEEKSELMLKAATKNTLQDVMSFLKDLKENTFWLWTDAWNSVSGKYFFIKKMLEYKGVTLPLLSQQKVMEKQELFIDLIEMSDYVCCEADVSGCPVKKENKEDIAAELLLIFSNLYNDPLKKSYENKLYASGFKEMDILNLEVGIWILNNKKSGLFTNSKIRWWRLKRKWFQTLFLQREKISFEPILIDLLKGKMPRVIDGEATSRGFLFHGFHDEIPDDANSYLFFKLATMNLYNDGHRQYTDNPISIYCWDKYCINHPFNVDTNENIEWIRGLLNYIFPYGFQLDHFFINNTAIQVLSNYTVSSEKLEEKKASFNELFKIEPKEVLYNNALCFDPNQMEALFDTGYLSLDELTKDGLTDYVERYISQMDKSYVLDWLERYCKKNKWTFSPKDARILKDSFNSSWIISFSYGQITASNAEEKLSIFTKDEILRLLGLTCEMCIRIPDIIGLSNFKNLIAGYVANPVTRNALGNIAEKWYQELVKTDYFYLDQLNRDYLSKEEYEDWKNKKEEQIKCEKAAKAKRKHDNLICEIRSELKDLLSVDAFNTVVKKAKNLLDIDRLSAYYEVLNECMDGPVVLSKKEISSALDFYQNCYDFGIISFSEMLSALNNITETEE